MDRLFEEKKLISWLAWFRFNLPILYHWIIMKFFNKKCKNLEFYQHTAIKPATLIQNTNNHSNTLIHVYSMFHANDKSVKWWDREKLTASDVFKYLLLMTKLHKLCLVCCWCWFCCAEHIILLSSLISFFHFENNAEFQ